MRQGDYGSAQSSRQHLLLQQGEAPSRGGRLYSVEQQHPRRLWRNIWGPLQSPSTPRRAHAGRAAVVAGHRYLCARESVSYSSTFPHIQVIVGPAHQSGAQADTQRRCAGGKARRDPMRLREKVLPIYLVSAEARSYAIVFLCFQKSTLPSRWSSGAGEPAETVGIQQAQHFASRPAA